MSPPQWWLLLSGGRINAGLEEYQEILTVDEACRIHRIGYNAMYELLSTGKLKSYRNGPGMADSKGCRAGLHSAANQFAKLMKWTQGRSLRHSLFPFIRQKKIPNIPVLNPIAAHVELIQRHNIFRVVISDVIVNAKLPIDCFL